MILRLLGTILFIAIAVPLIIAFPPLALVAVGGGALWLGRRRGSGTAKRRRSTSPRGSSARRQRVRPARRQRTRASRGRLAGTGRLLLVGLGVVFLAGALINQAPGALAGRTSDVRNLAILLAAGGIVMFIWTRALRRPHGGKRKTPVVATLPGQSVPGSTVHSGTEFEWQVADLLADLNYRRVEHVGGPGDGGVDIIAEDNRGRTFLVQCKRFAPGKKVGSADVQKLIGAVVHHDADGGIFVTTASFTAAAIDLAKSGRVPIELLDGRDLIRLSRAVA